MGKTSTQLIFDQNKSQILNAIRDKGPISRIELTRETGISAPTVTRIVKSLMEDHLVKNLGLGSSSGGRPPVILEFDPDSSFVIGIEWEFTSIKGILANLDGKIIREVSNTHDLSKNIEQDLQSIIDLVDDLIIHSPLAESRLKGIGISAAGYINKRTGMIEYSPVQSWHNIDIRTPLKEKFDVPIYIDHQSRVLALSEFLYGDLGEVRDLIYLNLSYGMGAGIMIDGEVVKGYDGFSGEIGHLFIQPPEKYDSRICLCGKENCLAEFVSGRGIVKTAARLLQKGRESSLDEMCNGDREAIDTNMIIRAAGQGDHLAMEVLSDAGNLLGIALANIANIINPQIVVIGGILAASDYYLNKITMAFNEHGLVGSQRKVGLVASSLLENAAVRGSAALVLKHILNFS